MKQVYTSYTTLSTVDELSDEANKKWLGNSIVGGYS